MIFVCDFFVISRKVYEKKSVICPSVLDSRESEVFYSRFLSRFTFIFSALNNTTKIEKILGLSAFILTLNHSNPSNTLCVQVGTFYGLLDFVVSYFKNDLFIVGATRRVPRTMISQRIIDGEGMAEGEDLKDAASDFGTGDRNTRYTDDYAPYVSYDDPDDDNVA